MLKGFWSSVHRSHHRSVKIQVFRDVATQRCHIHFRAGLLRLCTLTDQRAICRIGLITVNCWFSHAYGILLYKQLTVLYAGLVGRVLHITSTCINRRPGHWSRILGKNLARLGIHRGAILRQCHDVLHCNGLLHVHVYCVDYHVLRQQVDEMSKWLQLLSCNIVTYDLLLQVECRYI